MSEQQFATELLQALGIEPSSNNISWIQQWIASEGPYGTQTGPLNIFPLGNTYSPQSIAAWLNTNGNFGGIGTYAQNIAAYLNGQTNNIGKSLSYFSGHGGGPVPISSSTFYNGLQAPQGRLFGIPGTGVNEAIGPTTSDASSNAIDSAVGSVFQPLANALESGGLLIAAALLIGIGGLWLVLSNPNTQTTIKEGAKAAVLT